MMLLLVQILSIITVAFAVECPPRDKVLPCSCDEDEGLAFISCEGFNNVAELEPAVKNTVGYNVSFGIYRSHLGEIPSDLFQGHTSIKLHIEQCVVASFGDTPFSGLENSLEILNIYSVVDRSWTKMDSFKLSHLRKLKHLFFAHNDVEEVTDQWFEGGPESLQQINFSNNKFDKIGEKAFASLINLQQIYVNENQFTTVARSMLPNPATDLWVLEARSNEIKELPEDAFEGYPRLKIVNFSGNKLKAIPESVWGQIWGQLDSVSLGNDVVCDENLKWIYSQKLPDTFEGKCGSGNDLKDKDLKSLKLEDFQ